MNEWNVFPTRTLHSTQPSTIRSSKIYHSYLDLLFLFISHNQPDIYNLPMKIPLVENPIMTQRSSLPGTFTSTLLSLLILSLILSPTHLSASPLHTSSLRDRDKELDVQGIVPVAIDGVPGSGNRRSSKGSWMARQLGGNDSTSSSVSSTR